MLTSLQFKSMNLLNPGVRTSRVGENIDVELGRLGGSSLCTLISFVLYESLLDERSNKTSLYFFGFPSPIR